MSDAGQVKLVATARHINYMNDLLHSCWHDSVPVASRLDAGCSSLQISDELLKHSVLEISKAVVDIDRAAAVLCCVLLLHLHVGL